MKNWRHEPFYWAPERRGRHGWTAFKDAGSAPTAPDPVATANAQTSTNVNTALTQGKINNPNVSTPYGQQQVTWGGGGTTFDQAGYDAALAKYNAGMSGSGRYGGEDGTTPFQTMTGGAMPTRDQFTTTTNADTPTITQTLNPAQQGLLDSQNKISQGLLDTGQTALGRAQAGLSQPFDLSGVNDIYNKAYAAQTARLDPQWQQAQAQQETQLRGQGLVPGGEAYDNAMRVFNNGKNDAYQQATNSAISTMPQTYQLAQSAYDEPLNEVNALRTGSQVQNPTFSQYNPTTVTPTNTLGAQQLSYNGGLNAYNAQVGQANSFNSGLMSAAGTVAGATASQWGPLLIAAMSDRRLKSDIRRVGTHKLGIGIYDYVIFGKPTRGVMADEVREVMPEAVLRHPSGYDMVRYDLIGGL